MERIEYLPLIFIACEPMKINVVGTSGSGKSTVARQLAEKFSVPYIELDKLFWRQDWQGTPDDEFWPVSHRCWAMRTAAGCWTAIIHEPNRSSGLRSIGSCGWTTGSAARCFRLCARAATRAGPALNCGPAPATARAFAVLFQPRFDNSVDPQNLP